MSKISWGYAYLDVCDILHISDDCQAAKAFSKNGKVVKTLFKHGGGYPLIEIHGKETVLLLQGKNKTNIPKKGLKGIRKTILRIWIRCIE